MRKHKVVRIQKLTTNGLIKEVERFCDEVEEVGIYEVLSVSFYKAEAFVTLRSYS